MQFGGPRVLNTISPTPELLPYTGGTFKQETPRVQVRLPVECIAVCPSLNDKCRRLEHASVLMGVWAVVVMLFSDTGACSNDGARVLNTSPSTAEVLPYTVGTF
jgi:hypothetical protein